MLQLIRSMFWPTPKTEDAVDKWQREYKAWAHAQTCLHCGRKPDETPTVEWMTEVECMPCYVAGHRQRDYSAARARYLAEVSSAT